MYVGVYEREITPPIGCDMPGYYCERLSTGVLDKLFCKAVVISESDENSENAAAVVVVDAVELNREFCCAVAKRASEFSGIPTENIARNRKSEELTEYAKSCMKQMKTATDMLEKHLISGGSL